MVPEHPPIPDIRATRWIHFCHGYHMISCIGAGYLQSSASGNDKMVGGEGVLVDHEEVHGTNAATHSDAGAVRAVGDEAIACDTAEFERRVWDIAPCRITVGTAIGE